MSSRDTNLLLLCLYYNKSKKNKRPLQSEKISISILGFFWTILSHFAAQTWELNIMVSRGKSHLSKGLYRRFVAKPRFSFRCPVTKPKLMVSWQQYRRLRQNSGSRSCDSWFMNPKVSCSIDHDGVHHWYNKRMYPFFVGSLRKQQDTTTGYIQIHLCRLLKDTHAWFIQNARYLGYIT